MSVHWIRCADDLPDRSGGYLCWDARDQHMWIGYWNDSGGADTYGDPRPLGWVQQSHCTHWAVRPKPPSEHQPRAARDE